MRTYLEIIIDAKDGKVPTHEECYFALLMADSRSHFLERDLQAIEEAFEKSDMKGTFSAKLRSKNVRETGFKFRKLNPLKYLGNDHPWSKKTKNFRNIGQKILEKLAIKHGGE
jgi:hypothetical protein